MSKRLTPYRAVAVDALMNWNGLEKEEATKIAINSTHDELENQIYAGSSMKYAVQGIGEYLKLSDEEITLFENAVLGQDDPAMTEEQMKVCSVVEQKLIDSKIDINDLCLYVLNTIHNGWVKDNAKNFIKEVRESKKYQHLPLEMIGWKEANADLLFLSPILNSIGVENLDLTSLQNKYNDSVKSFFKDNNLLTETGEISSQQVADKILEGNKFYSPLTETNSAKDEEEAKVIAEQVKDKSNEIITSNSTER